jgi:hypothetical protein
LLDKFHQVFTTGGHARLSESKNNGSHETFAPLQFMRVSKEGSVMRQGGRVPRNIAPFVAGVAIVSVAVGITLWRSGRQDEKPLEVRRPIPAGEEQRQADDAGVDTPPLNGVVVAADQASPPAEQEPSVAGAPGNPPPAQEPPQNFRPKAGTAEKFSPDLNPQVKFVADALRSQERAEQLSVAILPKPFDLAAYQADPNAYLNEIAPARVFQAAQPGPKVPQLQPVGGTHHQVKQGDSATLQVRALPGAPVTFTSFDMGEFENRLTSITVKASEEGVAQAKLKGTPGTYNWVNILAASPLSSGQVKFAVFVELPQAGAD